VIVVLGSRHDPIARSIVDALPNAVLCSADDLTLPGWEWWLGSSGENHWVAGGARIADAEVTGVLVRRTCVYPEELTRTHADDREYLAAETTAFLSFVLSHTGARVVNPVADGAFGEEAIRVERWMQEAREIPLEVAPLRLSLDAASARAAPATMIEVVGNEAFHDAPHPLLHQFVELAQRLRLDYCRFLLDTEGRLVGVSGAGQPSGPALATLSHLLAGRPVR
jgi:hypothetical protein